jgi:hypothetical protein
MRAQTIVNRSIYLFIAMLAFVAAGAAAGNQASSGFLAPAVEAKLAKVTLSDGRKVMRWSSPELNGKITMPSWSTGWCFIRHRIRDRR